MGFVVNYPPVTKVTVDETTNEVVVAAAGPRGPQGEQGEQGDPGAAASVAVGSTTTGAAGSDASVANSGTSSAAVLDFTIPRGDTGAQGIQGEKGDQGDPGVVAATAPLTYDSGTQTVGIDESGIEIAPSQVTGTAVIDSDSRLSDARTPTAHASSHESGGGDELTLAQSQVTGLTTDLAGKAPEIILRREANGYYSANNADGGGSFTPVESGLYISPAYLPNGNIDRIAVPISIAGTSGAVIRLGLYYQEPTSDSDLSLLLDAGTVDGTAAAFQSITVNQDWSGGILWLGAVVQGGAGTRPQVRRVEDANPWMPTESAQMSLFRGAYFQSSVTASLPATFTNTTKSLYGIRVVVRYS